MSTRNLAQNQRNLARMQILCRLGKPRYSVPPNCPSLQLLCHQIRYAAPIPKQLGNLRMQAIVEPHPVPVFRTQSLFSSCLHPLAFVWQTARFQLARNYRKNCSEISLILWLKYVLIVCWLRHWDFQLCNCPSFKLQNCVCITSSQPRSRHSTLKLHQNHGSTEGIFGRKCVCMTC